MSKTDTKTQKTQKNEKSKTTKNKKDSVQKTDTAKTTKQSSKKSAADTKPVETPTEVVEGNADTSQQIASVVSNTKISSGVTEAKTVEQNTTTDKPDSPILQESEIWGVMIGETEINRFSRESAKSDLKTKHADSLIDSLFNGEKKALQSDNAIYSTNFEQLEKVIADKGWNGEPVADTPDLTEQLQDNPTAQANEESWQNIPDSNNDETGTFEESQTVELDESEQSEDVKIYVSILETEKTSEFYSEFLNQKEQKLLEQIGKSKKFLSSLSGSDLHYWDSIKKKFVNFTTTVPINPGEQEPIETFQKSHKKPEFTTEQKSAIAEFEASDIKFTVGSRVAKIDGFKFYDSGIVEIIVDTNKTGTETVEFFVNPGGIRIHRLDLANSGWELGDLIQDAFISYKDYKGSMTIAQIGDAIQGEIDIMDLPLSADEETRLGELKTIIGDAKEALDNAPHTIMVAMAEIRKDKLYRGTHKTLKAFAEETFGLTREYAQLMARSGDFLKVLDETDAPKQLAGSVNAINEWAKTTVEIAKEIGLEGNDFEAMLPIIDNIGKIAEELATDQNGKVNSAAPRIFSATKDVVLEIINTGTVEINGEQMTLEDIKNLDLTDVAIKSRVVESISESLKAKQQYIIDTINDKKERRTKPHDPVETPKTNGVKYFEGEVPTASAVCSRHPITDKFKDNYVVNVFNAGYELVCGCKFQRLTTSGDNFVCIESEGLPVQN